MNRTNATFEQWVDELAAVAGVLHEAMGNDPQWRRFYRAGFSPSEAWAAAHVADAA